MPPKKIFISYSHKDEELLEEFKPQLSSLERQKLIEVWYDKEIKPGEEIDKEILRQMEITDIFILLISANFIDSEYCYGIERKGALEKYREKKAIVIPVIIKPCDWDSIESLKNLKALPTDAKPVTMWKNHDEAWLDVVNGIKKIINSNGAAKPNRSYKKNMLIHNITAKNSKPDNIVGRNKELKYISRELARTNKPIIITSGFGGIGKSSLAKIIAWDYIEKRKPFDFIIWVDIRRYDVTQIITFNYFLDEIAKAERKESDIPNIGNEEIKKGLVTKLLSERKTLLILDNYEDLLNFPDEEKKVSAFLALLPTESLIYDANNFIKILITTRELSNGLKGGYIANFRLEKLSLEDSIKMMEAKEVSTRTKKKKK